MSQHPSSPPSPTLSQTSDRFSLISTMDFKSIDELDPSLGEGHRIVFSKEVPVELRGSHPSDNDQGYQYDEVGSLEALRVKILLLQNAPEHTISSVRIELSSEADLFLHYTFNMHRANYKDFQKEQKLMVDYEDFPRVLIKMLTSCIKEPENFLAIFVITENGRGQLNFVQNMEYKFVELLTLNFQESPSQVIKQHISFRYNSLRSRLAMMHTKLQEVNNLVKLKNPSLLLQLQRNSRSTNSLINMQSGQQASPLISRK